MVRDHPKCVDVTLFCWVAILQTETGGVQQFRCHVSDGADRGRSRAAKIYCVWVRYDGDESVVSEAGMEIAIDEDVCL